MGERRPVRRAAGAWTAGLAALAFALAAAPAGASQHDLEFAVKANYLVRFAAFVQWPEANAGGPDAPVVICVVGEDPFGGLLDQAVAGQSANGRPLQARRLERIDARAGCHIAYLGRASGQTVAQALAALDGSPVLTVTDAARGTQRGVIHFVLADNRVRFHVDAVAASAAGLTISSRLLGLALSVRSRGRP